MNDYLYTWVCALVLGRFALALKCPMPRLSDLRFILTGQKESRADCDESDAA